MIYIAALVLLMSLFLMGVAWLTAHRTILPHMRKPGILWWPAIGLLFLSPIVAISGNVVTYSRCERECAVSEGGTPEHPYAEPVPKAYESCVSSGLNEIKRNAIERMKAGADLDPEALAKESEPDTRRVCRDMAEGACVAACYDPEAGT